MKKKSLSLVILLAIASLGPTAATAADGARELATESSHDYLVPAPDAVIVPAPAGGSVLYDNGPLVNCAGCGVGGADESVLQNNSLLMNLLGFGHQDVSDNRVADDFVVPAGHTWTIGAVNFWAYQAGSSNVSTMTGVNLQFWNGEPGGGGSVIAGDVSTNRLADTGWSGIYRVTEDTSGLAPDRPIMMQTTQLLDVVLTAGQYWIDWQTDGTLSSGPWAPPITLSGVTNTGNGLQSLDDGVSYLDLIDTGTDGMQNFPQGLPMVINGTTNGPTLTTSGSCPGVVTVSISGGTPNGSFALLNSPTQGAATVLGGSCIGAQLGLGSLSLLAVLPFDGSGSFSASPTIPAGACGLYLEAVDLSACTATTVGQL